MRETAFQILDALPSKIAGALGFLGMGYATIWPQEAGKKVEALMSPDSVQFWGSVGLAVVFVYWALWFWLRPKEPKHAAPAGSTNQKSHGVNSPNISGSNFRDINFHPAPQPQAPTGGPQKEAEWPIAEAIAYVAERIGDKTEDKEPARRALRQAAYANRIEIWGHKEITPSSINEELRCSEILSFIPPDYWVAFKICATANDKETEWSPHTEEEEGDPYISDIGRRYWALKVHSRRVTTEWKSSKDYSKSRIRDLGPNGWMAR